MSRYPVRSSSPMNVWTSRFDDFFNQVLDWERETPLSRSGAFPNLNVWEENDALHVEAEMPGMQMDQIEITLLDSELTIQGERESFNQKQEGVSYHRQERGYGKFKRAIRLPFDVDTDKIDAHLKDGVLHVVLPKVPEAKPRKIEIKSS